MSYAPIYSKLHELEERLATVEASKASALPASVASAASVASSALPASTASVASSDFDCSAMR